MKCMIIVLAVAAVAAGSWAPAPVHDTPEVAAAKAAHFAAVAHASTALTTGLTHGAWAGAQWNHGGHHDDGQWRGEGVWNHGAQWNHAGHEDDGQWRGEGVWNHGAQWNHAGHHDDGQWHGEGVWNHGAQWNHAGHHDDGQWHGEGVWNHGATWNNAGHHNDGQWHGEGVWTHGVHQQGVHDTPEVAAAKAAHLAAHQAIAHRHRRSLVAPLLRSHLLLPAHTTLLHAPLVHTAPIVVPAHGAHITHWV